MFLDVLPNTICNRFINLSFKTIECKRLTAFDSVVLVTLMNSNSTLNELMDSSKLISVYAIMTYAQLNKNFVRIVSHSAHIVLKRVYDDRLQYNTKVSDMLLFLGFTTIIKFVSNFIRAED